MTEVVERKSLKYINDDTVFFKHQVEGIRNGARRTSFLLADEPGLGKTLQALTVAAIDFERDYARRVLVVAPSTLKWNWEDEILKFTKFRHLILDGVPKERERQLLEFSLFDYDILIVNYEQLKSHVKTLNTFDFDIIIYDEAHMIKSHNSLRTKYVHELCAKRHILLTGTPMLNQVNELWSLLHRIDPLRFPNYWPFVSRYCAYGGYRGKQIIGTKNKSELEALLKSVMIRRLKKDVLDLPEKQRIPIHVDLLPEQRILYDSAMTDLEIELPDSPDPMELENALVKYLKLKQICGTTATIPGYEDNSAKLDRAIPMLTEFTHDEPDSPSEPVVVFTQFRDVSRCLSSRLAATGIKSFELNGDVKKQDRPEMVRTWSTDKGPTGRRSVIIVMLQMAVGLNMTAASKCIFVDKLYVPKLNEQAEDRLHRIGADKTKPIQIFEIIARKTLEQRIESILKVKKKLFDSLVEENDWKAALYAALKKED